MIAEFAGGVGPQSSGWERSDEDAGGRTRTGVRTTTGVTGLGEVMSVVACGGRDLYMTLCGGIGKLRNRNGQDAVGH